MVNVMFWLYLAWITTQSASLVLTFVIQSRVRKEKPIPKVISLLSIILSVMAMIFILGILFLRNH